MNGLSLVGKVKSHSEGRRRSVEVGTRLGAGVEAEGVVAEPVSYTHLTLPTNREV